MYDVVVVGAGPCGSAAAGACAAAGLSTLCIEEHATIGYPVQCAGLLSARAFDECGTSRRPVLHQVSGAAIAYGDGRWLRFDAGSPKAYVVDRGALDVEMAARAADRGAEFAPKTAACGLSGTTLVVRGKDGRREIPFRLLIAADGPRSTISRLMGMPRARAYLAGIQAEVPRVMDPALVEIYPHASPDFFGWAIPCGSGRARVGCAGFQGVRGMFDAFIAPFGANNLHLVTGTIPIGVMPRTYGHRTLFVGDAAGFAKPTSGGGVYTGIRSALHAASTAVEACERGDFSDRMLSSYEKRWQSELGRELGTGLRLFELRQRMGREKIDRVLGALDDPELLAAIVRSGDMDRPSQLAAELLRKPRIVGAIGIALLASLRACMK